MTRQTTTGKSDAGWFPDERISIQDAIRAYTYNTAYANFEEKIKGSIEVGKFADLTVLSKNLLRIPPGEILTTEVVYTIVNGKIVYNAKLDRFSTRAALPNLLRKSASKEPAQALRQIVR